MKVKRNNLTSELSDFELLTTPKKQSSLIINYDAIINKQAQVVQNLYKECAYLRQQLNRIRTQEKFSQTTCNSETNISNLTQVIQLQILKQFSYILQLDPNQISKQKVIQTIKRIKWQRQKRAQPIFIQRIKEVRIPIPIQTIVEKPVVIYKTEYVQKIVQKIVQVDKLVQIPIFQQKIVQKFVNTKANQKGKQYSSLQPNSKDPFIKLQEQSISKKQKSSTLIQQSIKKQDSYVNQKVQLFKPEKQNVLKIQNQTPQNKRQNLNKTTIKSIHSSHQNLNKSFSNKGYSPKYKQKDQKNNDQYFKKDNNNHFRKGSWNKSEKDYRDDYIDKNETWRKQDNYKQRKYYNGEAGNKNIKRRTKQDRDFQWERRR